MARKGDPLRVSWVSLWTHGSGKSRSLVLSVEVEGGELSGRRRKVELARIPWRGLGIVGQGINLEAVVRLADEQRLRKRKRGRYAS